MKIRYTLSFKEYYRYQLLLFRHFCRASPLLLYFTMALCAVLLAAPAASDLYGRYVLHIPGPTNILHDELTFLAIPLVEIPVVSVLFMPLAWLLYRRPFLEISREGVFTVELWFKMRMPWRKIILIEEDESYISIGSKLALSGRVLFAMVPKRAFSSPEEAQAFFDQAAACWEEATGANSLPAKGSWPPAPKATG